MSIHCEWVVLCERVLKDAESQNLTLVQCLDQVNAYTFPAQYPGFAFAARFRWEGDPPAADLPCEYRFVRCSAADGEEIILTFDGTWKAGTLRTRIYANFRVLRLVRAEVLRFRVDHRLPDEEWVLGDSTCVDVLEVELTAEQRETLRRELDARGLPVPPHLAD